MIPTCPEGFELARNDRTGRWECRAPGWRGLGDAIAAGIELAASVLPAKAQGWVKNCGGCAKRQEKLNELWPL